MALVLAGTSSAKAQVTADRQEFQSSGPAAEQGQANVLALINSSPQYSIFATMLQHSGLASLLSGKGPFTVFVPPNSAFANLSAEELDNLLQPQNKRKLAALVTSHILPGSISSAEWNGSSHLGVALGGQTLTYTAGQHEQINHAAVMHKDLHAGNGVVHVINAPLGLTPSP